jgi:hypothetical protein
MLMSNMVIVALFAGSEDSNFLQKIIGGIFAALIGVPTTFVFKMIFSSIGVDPKTRARWDRVEEERMKKKRAELALSVATGGIAATGGVAVPPMHLRGAAPPQRMRRGYVPHPDHERMGVQQPEGGAARYKRRLLSSAAALPFSPVPEGSVATSGSSFGVPVASAMLSGTNFGAPPAPLAGPGAQFSALLSRQNSADVQDSDDVHVGTYIPRRALPFRVSARPPAPVILSDDMHQTGVNPPAPDQTPVVIDDDDDFEGPEKREAQPSLEHEQEATKGACLDCSMLAEGACVYLCICRDSCGRTCGPALH